MEKLTGHKNKCAKLSSDMQLLLPASVHSVVKGAMGIYGIWVLRGTRDTEPQVLQALCSDHSLIFSHSYVEFSNAYIRSCFSSNNIYTPFILLSCLGSGKSHSCMYFLFSF